MKPRWVTFTGLDERTDMARVAALTRAYPVEWGVLFGGRLGKNRYPPRSVSDAAVKLGIPLSMHLCGPRAAEANEGTPPASYHGFSRIQVNRAQGQYDLDAMARVSRHTLKTVVVQHRTARFPPSAAGVQWLQDTSGGKGRTAAFWAIPDTPEQLVGYAGGLNPDNVADAVARMPAKNFWIDMETGVRTDDWLDLDKCEAVCRAVYG